MSELNMDLIYGSMLNVVDYGEYGVKWTISRIV